MFETLGENTSWPVRTLGDFLTIRKDLWVDIDDTSTYEIVGVTSRGGGIAIRRSVMGIELTMRRYQLVSSDQLMWCKVDTKNGAFGVTKTVHIGALASMNMCLADINLDLCLPTFLQFFFRIPVVANDITTASLGTTNRQYLKLQELLDQVRLHLPPLSEQRRIVARIEELASKIEEARGLRREAVEEADTLLVAMAHRTDLDEKTKRKEGWELVSLGDVIRQVVDAHPVNLEASYPNLGIYSFGRGLFKKPAIEGLSTSAKTLYRVRSGQFIYSRLFAFEGSYSMVSDEFDGYFVSSEYLTFECDPDRVRAEFLYAYFKSPSVWEKVATGSKGLGDRRQRVQPNQALAHQVLLPPMDWQNRISRVLSNRDLLKRLQTETAAELDALLPSVLDKAFRGEL